MQNIEQKTTKNGLFIFPLAASRVLQQQQQQQRRRLEGRSVMRLCTSELPSAPVLTCSTVQYSTVLPVTITRSTAPAM